jgi:hypothetical protein
MTLITGVPEVAITASDSPRCACGPLMSQPSRLRWGLLPIVLIFGVSLWVRYGPVIPILFIGGGMALGLLGNAMVRRGHRW